MFSSTWILVQKCNGSWISSQCIFYLFSSHSLSIAEILWKYQVVPVEVQWMCQPIIKFVLSLVEILGYWKVKSWGSIVSLVSMDLDLGGVQIWHVVSTGLVAG